MGPSQAYKYTFLIISRLYVLRMGNSSDKIYGENQSKHFMFNNFFFPKIMPLMR